MPSTCSRQEGGSSHIIPFLFLLGGLLIEVYISSTYEPLIAMNKKMYNSGINRNYLPTHTLMQKVVVQRSYRTMEPATSSDRTSTIVAESTLSWVPSMMFLTSSDRCSPRLRATSFLNLSTTTFEDRGDYAAMMIGSYYMLSDESNQNVPQLERTTLLFTLFLCFK